MVLLGDHRALLATGAHLVCCSSMSAKDLLAELVLTRWAYLLRRDVVLGFHHALLHSVLAPDSFFIQFSIKPLNHICIAYLMHLETLFEVFELLYIFLLQHLSDQEPM
jgi:hypothetical protein